jgi:hypothetical protein
MSDAEAIRCFRQQDAVGLFRRLNAIWMVVILETLDELARQGMSMDATQWRSPLQQAGIHVPRMEAAMGAVRAKLSGATDWTQYVARTPVSSLPPQQIEEIRAYMGATTRGQLDPRSMIQLASLDRVFVRGFILGFQSTLRNDVYAGVVQRVLARPLDFELGYIRGAIRGLGLGLKNLVGSVIEIFQLGASMAVIQVTLPAILIREGVLLITSSAERELRSRQITYARAVVTAVNAALADAIQNPNEYVELSERAGEMIGAHIGSSITADIASRDAAQLGELAGVIAGQVLFEILVQVLLAAATEGAGNAVRAGVSLGEATQGGTRLAELALRLRPMVLRLPGMRRLFAALGAEREVAGLARVDAEISRAVEAAFAEGAQFESSVMQFVRVGQMPASVTAEQMAAWRTLNSGAAMAEDLGQIWRSASNPAAEEALAEIRRLVAAGDDASRVEARRLARITYDNWRRRFMQRLRDPANQAVRGRIERAGFEFKGGPTTSPRLAAGPERLTLDHSTRIMDDPLRCVDPTNLQWAIGYENSVTLEQLRNLTSVQLF